MKIPNHHHPITFHQHFLQQLLIELVNCINKPERSLSFSLRFQSQLLIHFHFRSSILPRRRLNFFFRY